MIVFNSELDFITDQLKPYNNLKLYISIDPHITDKNVIDNINQSVDIVIISQMTHPYNYRTVGDHFKLQGINKPWLQITWDTQLPKTENYINFFYWAANFEDFMYEAHDREKYQNGKNYKRKYLYSCLNNIAKAHRLCVLIKIFYSNYSSKCLTSMSRTTSYGTLLNEEFTQRDIREFSTYSDQQILDFFNTLPQTCPQESDHKVSFWLHDAYINSYLNVVTEHDFESKFFSEKSIKPFLTETMAIFVAGPGTVQLLRDIGLDVFDDIIDHSYDNENDPTVRLSKIHTVLDQMSIWNWEVIYSATADRRKANRDFLLSGSLMKDFTQKLAWSINNLVRS